MRFKHVYEVVRELRLVSVVLNAAASFSLILSCRVHFLHIIESIAIITVSDTFIVSIYYLCKPAVILKCVVKGLSRKTLF